MKRIMSLIILFLILFNYSIADVSAMAVEKTDDRTSMNIIIEDPFSEQVLQNSLYDNSKVQKCKNLSEGESAKNQLIKKNSLDMKRNENELFVDNCVMVKSSQDIAFDTSNVISAVRYDDKYYIQYNSVDTAHEAAELLSQYPSVIYAETDYVVSMGPMEVIRASASSPLLGRDGYTHLSWGITQTGLDIFADYVSDHTSDSVNIAVIDSGVHSSHAFLQGYISNIQKDFVGDDGIANDPHGHGTFVAGIIVDAMRKLNFNIIPVRVLDSNGEAPNSRVVDGIEWAVENGADVINLSLGGPTEVFDHVSKDTAIRDALANNVSVVVAAGNDYGNTVDMCPAHMDEPIVVSGIDKNGTHCDFSNKGDSVDVTGPALDVKSCVIPSLSSTGYGLSNGTSFAAPHVTAAAAMLRLLYPTYSAATIQNIINTCVDDVGTPGNDNEFGHGLMKISNRVITVPFTDVPKSKYYYDGVYSGYGRGYLTGLTSTTFGPNVNMERQDVAVVLYRMAGSPNVVYRNIFSDVSGGHYYAKAIVWAYDNGIVTGLNGTTFGVGQPITREDFAVILYRYAEYRDLDTSDMDLLDGYIDSGCVSDYAWAPVGWAVAHGIMGTDPNYLWPENNIIRADIATMLYRFLSL